MGRPLVSLLLLPLLLTWGLCPCMVDGLLVGTQGPDAAATPVRSCCSHGPRPTDEPTRPERPEDCPCCTSMGFQRQMVLAEAAPAAHATDAVAVIPALPPPGAPRDVVAPLRRTLEDCLGPPDVLRKGTVLRI